MTLTKTEKITVIITTHYIEEARQAHVVGLMRHGRLLAEASPEDLLIEHRLETLEEVFLKLCMTDSSARAAALAGGNSLSTLAVDSQVDLTKDGNDFKSQDSKYQSALSVYSTNSYPNATSGYNSTVNLVDPSSPMSKQQDNRFVPSSGTNNASRPPPKGAKYEKKTLTLAEYWSTTTALFWKNFTRLRRNIP